MKWLDRLTETTTRNIAHHSSRRSFLGRFGAVLVGAAATVPLLPVARASTGAAPSRVPPQSTGNPQDPGDPTQCDYWRYCAIDGFLCACCGGTATACPPGTEMAAITWVGTCKNVEDGRDYIIAYNDCCGKGSCGRCMCNRNEGDRPTYVPSKSNDYNWCVGSKAGTPYHCTVSRVMQEAGK